ncbi:hypothetical protein HDU82_005989 [Entophlyctis luteolus]|nr:hypothetical protein HDU82_005989 [Entophlyctis luteolus]KAJ3384676.1 hypothetical protein HDU84_002807 [Entophlyctis sp. JEL0112]
MSHAAAANTYPPVAGFAPPKLLAAVTRVAALAASSATVHSGRHAAALVSRKGVVLATGVSQHSHPRSATSRCRTVHAEVHCIANWLRSTPAAARAAAAVDLLVVRVANAHDNISDAATPCDVILRNSEPCADCARAIKHCSFIKRVYYTAYPSESVVSLAAQAAELHRRVKHRSGKDDDGTVPYRSDSSARSNGVVLEYCHPSKLAGSHLTQAARALIREKRPHQI